MSDQNESRLAKIRALLAKAEATTFPAEAEAYTAKAAALISQWGLEEAIAEARAEDRPDVTEKIVTMEGSYQTEKSVLLYRVAKGLGVRTVKLRGHNAGSGGVKVHVFGMPNDIVRVELLFTSLLVQASQGLHTARPWNPNESIKAYRRSWMSGFAHAVGDRLDAQRTRDTREAGAGTDLVLFDRAKLVDQRVQVFYPKLTTLTRRLSGSGGNAGRAAGHRANLSTGSNGVRTGSRVALGR
ncbi:DUF2786 domain-containing protein [Actinoplanes sp. NPDC026670]|uniref:DUF2786 domain-containing protein n=1 Tax=Actinoplanes sp. NPDC026670 TaxID=3154700 RepID=UPI0033D611D4